MHFSFTTALAQLVFVGIPVIILVTYFVRKRKKQKV